MFDRRSGVDRRRLTARIYWPERRRAERRLKSDRRRLLPHFGAGAGNEDGDVPGPSRPRVVAAAREWIGRFSR